jgi:drug/metabolite transporter (DMT)-like permease
MSQLFALSSAVMFGLGDFTGGFTTKRLPVWSVMFWSQFYGVPILVAGFALVPVDEVRGADVAWGAAGGLLGLFGLAILYTALAGGRMSVIAPITGATTAMLPVVFDLATGASLSRLEWLGITLGVVAVVLLGVDSSTTGAQRREVLLALLSGVAFAAFFIALAQTDEAAGLWPVAGARLVSLPAALALIIFRRTRSRPTGRDATLVTTAGTLDMGANIALLLALQRGSLAVSSVLSSMYPAVTAIAAVIVLKERPSRAQQAGIAVALGAVAALAG